MASKLNIHEHLLTFFRACVASTNIDVCTLRLTIAVHNHRQAIDALLMPQFQPAGINERVRQSSWLAEAVAKAQIAIVQVHIIKLFLNLLDMSTVSRGARIRHQCAKFRCRHDVSARGWQDGCVYPFELMERWAARRGDVKMMATLIQMGCNTLLKNSSNK